MAAALWHWGAPCGCLWASWGSMGAPWGPKGAQMALAKVAEPVQWADSQALLLSLVYPGVAGRCLLAGVLLPGGGVGAIETSLAVSVAEEQYGLPVAC